MTIGEYIFENKILELITSMAKKLNNGVSTAMNRLKEYTNVF